MPDIVYNYYHPIYHNMHRELNEEKQQKDSETKHEGRKVAHSRTETDEDLKIKDKKKNEDQQKEVGNKRKQDGERLEPHDLLADILVDELKNQKNGQSQLFQRTDSFYEDEPPVNATKQPQPKLKQQAESILTANEKAQIPSVDFPEEPKNKYIRCLKSAHSYLQVLRISYYLHLLRFLFIMLIYFNMSFRTFDPNAVPKQKTDQTTTGSTDQNQNRGFYPWNAMIYFLSGSIDFISIIGFISSIKLLRADIKILQTRRKSEDERILRQQAIRQRNRFRSSINEEQIEPQPGIEPQLQLHNMLAQVDRSMRVGKQSVYMSVYTALRQYKYKNRDQAAPFKISKIMHIFATFLFFGRMALIELYEFELSTGVKDNLFREIYLWLFLLSAYFAAFQIDHIVMESSTGPFIKIDKFHFSKILHIYRNFWQWRKKYGVLVKIGVGTGAFVVVADLVNEAVLHSSLPSVIFFLLLTSVAINFLLILTNRRIIKDSQTFIEPYAKAQIEVKNSRPMDPTIDLSSQSNLHKMIRYKNLCLLGILAKHSKCYDQIITALNRITLFLFAMALLRESNTIDAKPIWFAGYSISLVLFVLAEFKKFRWFMNAKINLLDSCKYKEISFSTQKNKQMHDTTKTNSLPPTKTPDLSQNPYHQPQPENQNNISCQSSSQACSICLLEYAEDQNVIAVCCGHIFHEQCLIDWLKQKKQCPLCRLNISEYYEEVSY